MKIENQEKLRFVPKSLRIKQITAFAMSRGSSVEREPIRSDPSPVLPASSLGSAATFDRPEEKLDRPENLVLPRSIIIIIIIRSRRQQRSVASTQIGHDDELWTIRHEC